MYRDKPTSKIIALTKAVSDQTPCVTTSFLTPFMFKAAFEHNATTTADVRSQTT